jgi:GNAT superfamily N-acetyltransferase
LVGLAQELKVGILGSEMSPFPALQAPLVTIRTATSSDHDALQALDGAAPDAGANLIQARRDFFSRMAAYDRTRVLVAEVEGRVVGVLCLALTPVRVAGQPCPAGYSFNIRVAPGQQTRGVGTRLMNAGAEWLEREGCRYVTGLIGVSNDASMKMVQALGWETVGRFDYLILNLDRFGPDPAVRIRKVDALGDPAHAAWRFGEVSLHHFVPRYLVSELFRPHPRGPYMGSLTAFGPGGSAWVSLWDDRVRRGLDPSVVRAVKAYDVTLKGAGGFRAFSAIAYTLREAGLDHVLMPLPHDTATRAVLEPYAGEIVEFNFVIKRLNGAGPLPPGPIYFDIRH